MGDDIDHTSDPLEVIRRRQHIDHDMLRVHEGKIGEHAVLIGVLTTQVEALRQTTASREQVNHASELLSGQMKRIEESTVTKMNNIEASTTQLIASTEEALTSKMDHMIDKIDTKFNPILKAGYWAIGIVMTSVVLALLALVLKSAGGQ